MITGSSNEGGMDGHLAKDPATPRAGREDPGHGDTNRGTRKPLGSPGSVIHAVEAVDDAGETAEDATRGGEVEADDGTTQRHPAKDKVLDYNRFIDDALKGLDPMTAVVWLVLFRFARGGTTWASQETIAQRMGVDPKTVMRHIKILKTKQLVRVVKKGSRGGRANTYQLGILPLELRVKAGRSRSRKPR
jgi:hypothetical protein